MDTGRHNPFLRSARLRQRALRASVAVSVVVCFCLPWIGCTPQKRYETLSIFFDGVPNPNASSSNANGSGTTASQRRTGRAPLAYQHKPFAEGNCAACHQPDKKIDVAHVKQGCIACHPKVETQYPAMHAPVATGECLWCHLPHESSEPNLLVASSPKLCRQCHDSSMLAPDPPAHRNPERNCLDCHLGHGAATGHFLKPGASSTTGPSPRPAPLNLPVPVPVPSIPTRGGAS